MIFSSTILNEQNKSNNTSSLSLRNIQESMHDSFIYELLESNDIMHQIDTEENIGYYRYLAEYSNGACTELVMNEGIVSGIHALLSKAIQTIINLINKFINFIRGGAAKASAARAKKTAEDFKQTTAGGVDPESNLAATKKLKVFIRPDIGDINEGYISGSLNNITSALDRVLSGGNPGSTDDIEKDVKMVYTVLKKIIIKSRETYKEKVTNSETFRAAVSADVIYAEEREMKVSECIAIELERQKANSNLAKEAEAKMAKIRSILVDYEKKVESRGAAIKPEARDHCKSIINKIQIIVNDIIWYFGRLTNINVQGSAYVENLLRKAKGENVHESSTIHGEMFDGNTLFDNEDYRDFNRTEWLDLELTAECYAFSAEARETKRRIAANEAVIFAEGYSYDTFKKLVAMREAEEKKLGDRFMEIIKNIMTAIDKFFANLRDKLSLDVDYIRKNMQYINKPFNFQELKSTGDILNGLDRILNDKLTLEPYNYATMQNDLADEKEFFKNHIRSRLTPVRSEAQGSDVSPSEYCKAYFGASMPKDRYKEIIIGNEQLEGARRNIMDFLLNPNNKLAKIREDVRKLEQEAKKASTKVGEKPSENPKDKVDTGTDKADESANKNQTAQIQAPENNAGGEQNTNESMYYSELYQRWFTEAEVNNGKTATETAKKSEKDGFKSYINAYKNVLLAKLTGAAFVRTELMQIITYHAQVNGAPKRVIKSKNAEPDGKATPKDQKKNQQQQQGQAEGQPAN